VTDLQRRDRDELRWHAMDAPAVLACLDSSRDGLPDDERSRRRTHHGPNTVASRKTDPWWEELAESFTEPLQLLLIAVAVLSAVFGELTDAIAIAAVIIVVAVVETVTELRAARSIAALSAMSAPSSRLVREDAVVDAPAADLVPGDVIAVESGDVVPADSRVLHARGLRADESSLTGEAQPVGKDERSVTADADLAERTSMVHAGTAIVAGEARAVVVATGAHSELGVLGRLVESTGEPPTPLQLALSQLARAALVAALVASVVVPVVGVLAGQPWRDMLLVGLTVAFATVPEELPILITVLLAVGGRQLAARGALLRRLRAGETLGAVTTVVTDKTGTLTENHLRLTAVIGDRRDVLNTALHAQAAEGVSREPMELELAVAAGEQHLRHTGEPVAAFPFDPTRKLVSRAWDVAGGRWLAVSGSPEAVLARCCTLTPQRRREIEQTVDEHASRGLRVIGFAHRQLDRERPVEQETAERGLHFVGLAAFADPLRDGVPEAVAALSLAGVATIVCTGDHPVTATAVATQAGLPAAVSLGREIAGLTDPELDSLLGHGTVIARATPTTKHRVVQVLQRRGEIVAVTGDGANDAPALAAADVGIALGRRGADLARAAADLVLTDDAYPTVVGAIAKGRNITAQLRRAVAFYLGAKLALVAVLLAALAAGRVSPFQPIHIVLLEVFMDLGASVAFVAEPAAPQAMRQPPRPPGTRFLDRTTLATIGLVATILTAAVLPAYLLFASGPNIDTARTAAVLAWLVGHVLIAWTLRTRPSLSWKANIAFPSWAGAAIATGVLLARTPLGGAVHLGQLGIGPLAVVGALLAAALAAAMALRRGLRLDQRL